jgi:hypothetical protein
MHHAIEGLLRDPSQLSIGPYPSDYLFPRAQLASVLVEMG